MASRPLSDVLRDLESARAAGEMPPDVYESRKRWIEANTDGSHVDFPDDWLTYGAKPAPRTAATPPRRPDPPGAGVATFLTIVGWIAIVAGVVAGFIETALVSEQAAITLGADATPGYIRAATTAVSGVVSGALLIAVGVVIMLLRQIAARD